MAIGILFIVLQVTFGFFVIRIQNSLISLQFHLLSLFYWLTLVTSSILYFSLTCINPGFVQEEEQVVDEKVFNSSGESLERKIQPEPNNQDKISDIVNQKQDLITTKEQNTGITQQQHITTNVITLRSLKSTSPIISEQAIQNQIPFELQKRYCRHCHIDQPHRTKHCYECQKCVATYDHHCPWVDNCIGENNRPLFYLFTISQNIQIIISMYITLKHLPGNLIQCAILFSFQLILFVLVSSLFGFHSYLMIFGCTTWQYLKWSSINYLQFYDRPYGPFYEGVCKNIKTFWTFLFKRQKGNHQWKVIDNRKKK